ncbi:MAG: Gfo/Idh/MocA family protein [Planctomycetota bacterium]
MARLTRRTFLKGSLVATGATFMVGLPARPVLGANERVNIAQVGVGGRGGGHLRTYMGMKDVEVTWCVDVDIRRASNGRKRGIDRAAKALAKARGLKKPDLPKDASKQEKDAARKEYEEKLDACRKAAESRAPKATQDLRKALDDKELDAISIATPNHWHTLATLWAVQAGKDVYVEKPATHNVFEGRICTDLIAKSDRIVQTGTQRRSSSHWAKMLQITKSGKLGKLLVSHGFASKPRGSIGFKKPEDPPEWLDWSLWLGPAQMQAYHDNLVHYNWHWFWDFGNGEIGNQGVHQTDVARWAIPGATHPHAVFSIGGRIGYDDQGQTPNTQLTTYDYGETLMVFEVCGLVSGKTRRVSNDFIYEAGRVVDGRKFYPKDGGGKTASLPKVDVHVFGGGPFGNFINCVRSRKKEELNAPFDEGHYSAAICHLGNISYRLGQEVTLGSLEKPFKEDYANEAWDRLRKHLTQRRKLDLGEWKGRRGLTLKFDPKTEQFIDAPAAATAMLTRDYRKPFVVRETV